MKKLIPVLSLAAAVAAGCSQQPPAPAQNTAPASLVGQATPAEGLVLANARLIDGKGNVIENGSIVAKDGRIVSVSAEAATVPGALVIDLKGKTVMPGLIDAHRHLIQGNPDEWMTSAATTKMQEFLDAGFTTVLSAIDPTTQVVDLKKQIDAGTIKGPRLIVGCFVPLAAAEPPPPGPRVDPARTDVSRPPDRPTKAARGIPEAATRGMVQKCKESGTDAVKTVITTTPGGPEVATLKTTVDEAQKVGLKVIVHAVTVQDTMAAVTAKPTTLVHTPHIEQITEAQAKAIAAAGIPMTSTLGVFVPTFDEDNAMVRARTGVDNLPRFRDLDPFPMNTLSSAGQGPVNARLIFDAGVVYGYGTDTQYVPHDALRLELRPLRLVFSAKDIVKIMTENTAALIGRSSDLGTLEAGKIADFAVFNGNPLDDVENLLDVALVVKDGQVVVDKR